MLAHCCAMPRDQQDSLLNCLEMKLYFSLLVQRMGLVHNTSQSKVSSVLLLLKGEHYNRNKTYSLQNRLSKRNSGSKQETKFERVKEER